MQMGTGNDIRLKPINNRPQSMFADKDVQGHHTGQDQPSIKPEEAETGQMPLTPAACTQNDQRKCKQRAEPTVCVSLQGLQLRLDGLQ